MATWHAAAALTLLCAAPARMQPPDTPVRLERVADRVYVILHPDATEDRPTSNTGVVIGDDGVLVVDTGYLPSIAREDIGVIQSLTDKPVRYVVYTHAEFDHTNGAIAYRQAFPSADVVGERSTATHMESDANEWLRAWTGPGAPALEELRDLYS